MLRNHSQNVTHAQRRCQKCLPSSSCQEELSEMPSYWESSSASVCLTMVAFPSKYHRELPICSLYDSLIWTPGLAGFGQSWICWPSTISPLASLCTITGWYTQTHHQELLLLPLDMGFQHQTSWIPLMLSPHWMLIWRVPSFFWGWWWLPALACLLHLLFACLLLHIRPWISQDFPNQAQLGFDVWRENTVFWTRTFRDILY